MNGQDTYCHEPECSDPRLHTHDVTRDYYTGEYYYHGATRRAADWPAPDPDDLAYVAADPFERDDWPTPEASTRHDAWRSTTRDLNLDPTCPDCPGMRTTRGTYR